MQKCQVRTIDRNTVRRNVYILPAHREGANEIYCTNFQVKFRSSSARMPTTHTLSQQRSPLGSSSIRRRLLDAVLPLPLIAHHSAVSHDVGDDAQLTMRSRQGRRRTGRLGRRVPRCLVSGRLPARRAAGAAADGGLRRGERGAGAGHHRARRSSARIEQRIQAWVDGRLSVGRATNYFDLVVDIDINVCLIDNFLAD